MKDDSTQLNGRRPFVWRGLNPDDDTNRLVEKIAEAAATKLFNVNGSLVLFSDGQTLPVTRPVLHEIITKIIAGVRLVAEPAPAHRLEHDVAVATLKTEFYSFGFEIGGDLSKGPNDRTLASITDALLSLVAKGPQEPRLLNEQRKKEVRDRLKIGERPENLARSYNVYVDTIKQLVG